MPSARYGDTVGRTTAEPALEQQLHRFKMQQGGPLTIEQQRKQGESLQNRCISILAERFEEVEWDSKAGKAIPKEQLAKVTIQLSTELSPLITGKRVSNENYWKKLCLLKYTWDDCHLVEHGMRWKQLYFEKMIQEKLEECNGDEDSIDFLVSLFQAVKANIFAIKFRQLPSHMNLHPLLNKATNLNVLDICYGVNKIGMQYDRAMFGMKINDAISLAKVFEKPSNLTTLILSKNMIDDDLLRLLMVGLEKNTSITHLNLAHNKITDFGVQLISKLLGKESVLMTLDLSDNQIYREGGRHLARELRDNEALQRLSLRLNRLGDEGCKEVFDAVADNDTLLELSLSANGAAAASSAAVAALIRRTKCSLCKLDISNNEFTAADIKTFLGSLYNNRNFTQFDLRNNKGYAEVPDDIMEIEEILIKNEASQGV